MEHSPKAIGTPPQLPPESPRISHSFKRTNSSRQKMAILESEGNPMAESEESAKEGTMMMENLSDAKQISATEFESMYDRLAKNE
jgi:hypothetical protein